MSVDDVGLWISVLLTALTVVLAYVTYADGSRTEIQFALVSRRRLLPPDGVPGLGVEWQGQAIRDPALVVVRIVNSGNRAIAEKDFSTDLSVKLGSTAVIVAAFMSSLRPSDLKVNWKHEKSLVKVKPFLFNPGDLFEVQLLTDGLPGSVTVEGRVREVRRIKQRSLPYPPGSEAGGRMNRFDKLMWIVPEVFIGVVALAGVINLNLSIAARVFSVITVVLAFGLVYPLFLRKLVNTSRLWRT